MIASHEFEVTVRLLVKEIQSLERNLSSDRIKQEAELEAIERSKDAFIHYFCKDGNESQLTDFIDHLELITNEDRSGDPYFDDRCFDVSVVARDLQETISTEEHKNAALQSLIDRLGNTLVRDADD